MAGPRWLEAAPAAGIGRRPARPDRTQALSREQIFSDTTSAASIRSPSEVDRVRESLDSRTPDGGLHRGVELVHGAPPDVSACLPSCYDHFGLK